TLVDREDRVENDHDGDDEPDYQTCGEALHYGFLERASSRVRALGFAGCGELRPLPSAGAGTGCRLPRMSWSSGRYIRLPLLSVSISTLLLAAITDSIVSI